MAVSPRDRFFDWFDGIVASSEERRIRPDPAIFARLFERHRIDPARAVVIDDSPGNVATANGLGWHGVHVGSPARLRDELTALGLLR